MIFHVIGRINIWSFVLLLGLQWYFLWDFYFSHESKQELFLVNYRYLFSWDVNSEILGKYFANFLSFLGKHILIMADNAELELSSLVAHHTLMQSSNSIV
jgi:hypothetical protein